MQIWYLYFSIIGLSPLPEFPSIPEIRVNRYFKACAWDHVKIACMSSKIYILMCIYHCMCTGLLNKFFFFLLICYMLVPMSAGGGILTNSFFSIFSTCYSSLLMRPITDFPFKNIFGRLFGTLQSFIFLFYSSNFLPIIKITILLLFLAFLLYSHYYITGIFLSENCQ